jgi:hypothetical protein
MLAASFSGWGAIDIFATLLVAIGVFGELWAFIMKVPFNPTNFSPLESKKRGVEKWSLIILGVGVFLEVIALPQNLSEVANLNRQTTELSLRVEELRKENVLLKARRITREQYEKFIKILKDKPKRPIVVYVEEGHFEAEAFAGEIRKMLNDAGYGFANDSGLVKLLRLSFDFQIDDTNRDRPIVIGFYGENTLEPIVWPHFKLIPGTNGQSSFSCDPDDPSAAGFIINAFQQIGIGAAVSKTKQTVKPGDWAIFVTTKF